ncbi:hypothetical protein E3U26_04245 [Paracoccus ferrooxidans]|nr:hypothetical protein E3U26_04245 [Paracoccus ferrooxidans]
MADQMKLSPDPRAYELIFAAYQTERFSSKIGQERAAAAYRDKISADCITTLSGKTETDGDRQAQFWTIDKPEKNSANP